MESRRRLIALVGVVLAAVCLPACGSGSGADANPSGGVNGAGNTLDVLGVK